MAREDVVRVDGKGRCGESGRQGRIIVENTDDGESGWQGRIIVARMMVRVDGKGGSLLHG